MNTSIPIRKILGFVNLNYSIYFYFFCELRNITEIYKKITDYYNFVVTYITNRKPQVKRWKSKQTILQHSSNALYILAVDKN